MSERDENTIRETDDLAAKDGGQAVGGNPADDVNAEADAEAAASTEVQAEGTDVEAKTAEGESTKPKKKKKGLAFKILLVVGIVVVVLAGGAGGAYALFHDEPAFCNAICHTPMDPYVESYEMGTSVNPVQAELTAPLSVTIHKESDQQINCLDCHVPDMGEQIQEGIKWVTGNYELPLEMKIVSGQIKEGSGDKAGVEFCLREGCHEGITTIADLKKSTDDQIRNPHDSHMDPANNVQDCSKCHQTHEQSFMLCSQCHGEAKVPEGWMSFKDQQAQKKTAGQ